MSTSSRAGSRFTSVVILAGVLAGGLVLQAADDSGNSVAAESRLRAGVALPASPPAASLSSTWFCAAGTASPDGPADHHLQIANPSDRARTATVTVLVGEVAASPADGEAQGAAEDEETTTTTAPPASTSTTARPAPTTEEVELPPQSRVDVRLGDITPAPLAGAVVEVEGGQVAVDHYVEGERGRATAPCSTSAAPSWSLPWGVTSRGDRELVVFMNPFPDDATVDVTFATSEGLREPSRFQGFIVPGRSVVGAYLHEDVGYRDQVSAFVQVRGGRLIVDRVQTFNGDNGRTGITLGAGVPVPAETWTFPEGITGDGLYEQVVVFNPTEEVAEVEIELRLDDPGEVGPPEPFELTVPPGRYGTIDVAAEERVPDGVGHAVIVRSLNGVPVAAERVNWGTTPAPHTGVTATSGSPFGADTWFFSGGGPTQERDEYLVLFNLSTDDEVTYDLTGFASGQTIAIQGQQGQTIPAGGRAVVRLGESLDREALSVVVTASGPIVAERGLHRIGGGGISQSMGIPLADDSITIPAPISG